MRVLYSEAELDALDLVSLPAERLYRQLRRRMDMRSCTVGRGASIISRGVLAIYCQYVPPRGSKNPPWKPSLAQVDALVNELIRNGLVVRAAAPQERLKLVLSFCLVSLRPQEERDMNATEERDKSGGLVCQENQCVEEAFADGEHDTLAVDERDMSLCLSDEMRERTLDGNDPQTVNKSDDAVGRVVRIFAKEVGGSDANLFKSSVVVREVAGEREVSTEEIRTAIVLARQQGAASVAAYAATIIRNGSLVSSGAEILAKKAARIAGKDSVHITERHLAIAKEHGLKLGAELGMFVANARSSGKCSLDWSAAFEVWLQRSAGFVSPRGGVANGGDLPWHMTASGIEAKAKEIGFVPPPGAVLFQWKYQLFDLVGLSEDARRADLALYA